MVAKSAAGDHRVVPKSVAVRVFAARGATAGPIALLSRLLLGWYLREVTGLDIPEEPGDAIVTYPLA